MNLTELLNSFASQSELLKLNIQLDGKLEVAALTDWVFKRCGPGLLLQQIKGADVELVTNLFGSEHRMATALGCRRLSDFRARLVSELSLSAQGDSAQRLEQLLPKAEGRENPSLGQTYPDLGFLPQLQYWPREQRSFLTLAVVITRNYANTQQNYGLYRIGIVDRNRLTLNLLPGSGGAEHLQQWRQRRERMPVAILLGADPGLIFAAAASLPKNCDEAGFSAWLQEGPLAMVDCRTLPLQCPSSSQVQIEGWINGESVLNEGPFGCYTGGYGGGNDCPLVELSSVSGVARPTIPLTLAGPLPMEDSWLARANLELLKARLTIDLPEVQTLEMPLDAAFHGLYFVKLANHRTPLAEIALGLRRLDYFIRLKMLVLLEDDETLDELNWRNQVQRKAQGQIWQESSANLDELLSPQKPQLIHDPDLIESLLDKVQRSGVNLADICAGRKNR